jgi:hypothetical protein
VGFGVFGVVVVLRLVAMAVVAVVAAVVAAAEAAVVVAVVLSVRVSALVVGVVEALISYASLTTMRKRRRRRRRSTDAMATRTERVGGAWKGSRSGHATFLSGNTCWWTRGLWRACPATVRMHFLR